SDPCRSGRRLKSPVRLLALELPAERFEGGPAGIRRLVLVGVRLVVQVLAAHGAKAGALRAAKDLVGQGERDRVTGPGAQVQLVVRQVRSAELVRPFGWIGRLILACRDRHLEHGIAEAPVAGTMKTCVEAELEDRARTGLLD